jgi:hypothetical protein
MLHGAVCGEKKVCRERFEKWGCSLVVSSLLGKPPISLFVIARNPAEVGLGNGKVMKKTE